MAKEKKGAQVHLIAIAVVLLLGYLLFLKGPKVLTQPVMKEDLSQLTSVDKYVGNGVATRSYSNGKFRLNITAFLPKPTLGQTYTVKLIAEALEPKEIRLGELTAAGDVYTLKFEGNTDYSGYMEIEVVALNTKANTEKILLKGGF